MNKQDGAKALDRYLSPLDVWAIAFGCMVGWGVFAMAAAAAVCGHFVDVRTLL